MFPDVPELSWCIITFEKFNDDLLPFSPDDNRIEPIEAEYPVFIVATSDFIYLMTSTIESPLLTDPPGESTCMVISFFSTESRYISCACTIVDILSLNTPATHKILSFMRRENISSCVTFKDRSSSMYGVRLFSKLCNLSDPIPSLKAYFLKSFPKSIIVFILFFYIVPDSVGGSGFVMSTVGV